MLQATAAHRPPEPGGINKKLKKHKIENVTNAPGNCSTSAADLGVPKYSKIAKVLNIVTLPFFFLFIGGYQCSKVLNIVTFFTIIQFQLDY